MKLLKDLPMQRGEVTSMDIKSLEATSIKSRPVNEVEILRSKPQAPAERLRVVDFQRHNMELDHTYWKDDGWYVGYLDEYPDYTTQGESLEEFEGMLRSLYEDIKTFDFSFVRHHGKLQLV